MQNSLLIARMRSIIPSNSIEVLLSVFNFVQSGNKKYSTKSSARTVSNGGGRGDIFCVYRSFAFVRGESRVHA